MPHPTPTTLFFAGTDTDVGKTYTAALVVRLLFEQGIRVGVYKPVASGCRLAESRNDGADSQNRDLIADDAVALWEAAGRPRTLGDVCPQRFAEPLAPPEAASAEGRQVDANLLRDGAACWTVGYDILIVEGAGGLFSPLADAVLNIDLVKQLDSQLVIVAANRLGAIHQTLATCSAAAHHEVRPAGIILCDTSDLPDPSSASNAAQIARYTDIPVLGCVPFGGNVTDVRFAQKLVD